MKRIPLFIIAVASVAFAVTAWADDLPMDPGGIPPGGCYSPDVPGSLEYLPGRAGARARTIWRRLILVPRPRRKVRPMYY